jgi:predicted membrane channel-forming protein YqfA (hemolysin III family)
MKPVSNKTLIFPSLSLLMSLGTLTCCALPSLFIALGAGAVLAGILTNMPFLIVLSKYKVLLFVISGTLIVISGFLIWYNRNAPCPADPIKKNACIKLRKISLLVYLFSLIIYLIGFFFAFLISLIK